MSHNTMHTDWWGTPRNASISGSVVAGKWGYMCDIKTRQNKYS